MIRFKIGVGLTIAMAAWGQGKLPPGPGKATVLRVCSKCHAVEVFSKQAHTKAEWADIVTEIADRVYRADQRDKCRDTDHERAQRVGPQPAIQC